MVRTKDTYNVSVQLPGDMEERVKALAKHEGVSVNAMINAAVRDRVLTHENEDTTRVRVARIEPTTEATLSEVQQLRAQVEELNRKFELLQSMGWAQLNALELTVKVSDSDWARVERLLQARG